MKVIPSGQALGATLEGFNLGRSLSEQEEKFVLENLGRYSVLRFPRQKLTAAQLRDFAARFGELEVNVASGPYQEPGVPEVMTLSNIVRDGKPIGLGDAGQGWHTDMSYSRTIALANVLYGIEIPRRDGKALGGTQFANMHAAYEGLPPEIKAKLDGKTILHDFEKFWEMMRKKGGKRPPLTDAQRKQKPPVSHPAVFTNPLSGRKVLYANPGYSIRINELPEKESDELLEFLFEHQVKPEYLYTFEWEAGDVLFWEDLGTIHNAIADYGPDEHRLIKRCQVMANRYGL